MNSFFIIQYIFAPCLRDSPRTYNRMFAHAIFRRKKNGKNRFGHVTITTFDLNFVTQVFIFYTFSGKVNNTLLSGLYGLNRCFSLEMYVYLFCWSKTIFRSLSRDVQPIVFAMCGNLINKVARRLTKKERFACKN